MPLLFQYMHIKLCTTELETNLNPLSPKPVSCFYAKNARGYLLTLQHCGKIIISPSIFKVSH
jgi:hypothetical protein